MRVRPAQNFYAGRFVLAAMQNDASNAPHRTPEDNDDKSPLALANVLSKSGSNAERTDLADLLEARGFDNFPPIGSGLNARGSAFSFENQPLSSSTCSHAGIDGSTQAIAGPVSGTEVPLTIAGGATVAIDGLSAQSVTFAGSTGTLKLDDPQGYAGVISGLSGADAIDLSGFAYGANVTATYSGNASGGTLTVTDGAKTAKIALSGDYLSSGWTLVQRRQGRHDRGRSDLAGPSRSAAAASSEAWTSPPTARWSRAPTRTAPTYGTERRGCNSSRRRACRPPSISPPRPRRLRDPNCRQQYEHILHAV